MAAGRAHSLVRRYLLGPVAVALPLLLLIAGSPLSSSRPSVLAGSR